MDRETSPKPPMCRGGCGFYGSAATEGLCSQCYKKHSKRKQEQEFLARTSTTKSANASKSSNTNTRCCYTNSSNTNSILIESTILKCISSGQGNSKRSSNTNTNIIDNNSEEDRVEDYQPSTSAAVSAPVTEPVSDEQPNNEENAEQVAETEPKEKKNRCAECGKKVGLTGFTCRCGGLFCALHRYSDRHNCTFDYRELGAEEIRRNNPTVTAEKIRKI